jgi:hypothetical protein
MNGSAVYRCVACGSRWRYEQVRTIARCRACGCGLARCGAQTAVKATAPAKN